MAGKGRLEIGDELPVWNEKDKIQEWNDRTTKAEEELADKKRITFYISKEYRYHYKLAPAFLYKQTVTAFRPLELGGAPRYKDHYCYFKAINMPDGRKLSRCVTSDPEVVAFLDMTNGIVREENRELTPLEQLAIDKKKLEEEKRELEKEKARMERAKEYERTKDMTVLEEMELNKKKREKDGDKSAKGKKGDN